MNKTLLDILTFSRTYIRLHDLLRAHAASGQSVAPVVEFDPQILIASLVACAKFPDNSPEIAGLIKQTARLGKELYLADRGTHENERA